MENIESFDNGLDVEKIIFSINEKKDPDIIKKGFEDAMKLDFIVPYKNSENELAIITTKDKGPMLPAFSNYTEFLKSGLPEDKTMLLPFMKIQGFVNGSAGKINGVIINPHGKSLMFEHHVNENIEHVPGQKLHLLKPNFIPDYFKNALIEYFKENEKVYRAFILWAQRDMDIVPHAFIIVDYDGDKESYLPSIAEKIKPLLKKGESIEFAKADFKLLQIAEKTDVPFYKK